MRAWGRVLVLGGALVLGAGCSEGTSRSVVGKGVIQTVTVASTGG